MSIKIMVNTERDNETEIVIVFCNYVRKEKSLIYIETEKLSVTM